MEREARSTAVVKKAGAESKLHELEELLSEHLATPVTVTLAGKHGKMVVEFADLEDLERIYRLMTEGPELEE